jgi:hypothetical protein
MKPSTTQDVMDPRAFGQWYGVSYRTVMRYLRDGMPCHGHRKHARRIPVAAAVAWLSRPARAKRGRPRNIDRTACNAASGLTP